MHTKLVISLLLIFSCKLMAQEKKLIQFTGRVFNEFVQPLPFTDIAIVNKKRGAITDREGKFTFVVEPFDTIRFTSMGYKKAFVIIPDTLSKKFYTRDVLLEADTFMIAEVEIYPWKDYNEFKEAILNLQLPEDDMDRAQRNIAMIKAQIKLEQDPSGSANYRHVMQQNMNGSLTRGTYPTYQIFNIMAWSKFFEALKKGDFKQNKE